jgi:hypothetical protein
MWTCFCSKKKVKPVLLLESSEQVVPALSLEDTTKLAELRSQFVEAQRKQMHTKGHSHHDQVVGYVEIPLYRSEGRSLRDAGQSFQMILYDQ